MTSIYCFPIWGEHKGVIYTRSDLIEWIKRNNGLRDIRNSVYGFSEWVNQYPCIESAMIHLLFATTYTADAYCKLTECLRECNYRYVPVYVGGDTVDFYILSEYIYDSSCLSRLHSIFTTLLYSRHMDSEVNNRHIIVNNDVFYKTNTIYSFNLSTGNYIVPIPHDATLDYMREESKGNSRFKMMGYGSVYFDRDLGGVDRVV